MDLVKVLQNGEKKEDTKLASLLLGDGKAEEEVRILKQIGFKARAGALLIVFFIMVGSGSIYFGNKKYFRSY